MRLKSLRNILGPLPTLPAVIFYLLVLCIPLFLTFALAFNSQDAFDNFESDFSFSNFQEIILDSYFYEIYLRTFLVAIFTVFLCLLIAIPETYIIFRMSNRWRSACLLIVLAPLLISVIVRTLGWAVILGKNGFISQGLLSLGVVDQAFSLLHTQTGVIIALTHVMLPFMIIPIWTALQKFDKDIANAAMSLGAKPSQVIRKIIIPQMMPGILSGSVIVFALSATAFATPSIIGGRRLKVVATLIYDEFYASQNWPLGASIAVILLLLVIGTMMLFNKWISRYDQKKITT